LAGRSRKGDGPVDYWLITTGPDEEPGINGALMVRSDPGASTWNTVEAPSVDEFTARVVAAGGKVISPRTAIPGVGYQAYCQDTEGNVFGVHQADDSAS
jgi:predicted enzyme related to lactoylglutathione lyase